MEHWLDSVGVTPTAGLILTGRGEPRGKSELLTWEVAVTMRRVPQ